MEEPVHLHLVSDATGETINSVARACLVQFTDVEPVEHVWSLIRTNGQMQKVLSGVAANPGPVLYTIVNSSLRETLEEGCRDLGVTATAVLDPVIHTLAHHLKRPIKGKPGLQHALDAEYFERIEAVNYSLVHDDGQATAGLEEADVVICGVSRTSKTPTCLYLANRGVKAANVPIVPNVPPPNELLNLSGPLVVGLTKAPERLVQVRRNRMRMIADKPMETDYIDLECVRAEVAYARRLYSENGWPVIDVTRRSIEETSAAILNHLARHRGQDAVPLSP